MNGQSCTCYKHSWVYISGEMSNVHLPKVSKSLPVRALMLHFHLETNYAIFHQFTRRKTMMQLNFNAQHAVTVKQSPRQPTMILAKLWWISLEKPSGGPCDIIFGKVYSSDSSRGKSLRCWPSLETLRVVLVSREVPSSRDCQEDDWGNGKTATRSIGSLDFGSIPNNSQQLDVDIIREKNLLYFDWFFFM